MTDVKIMFTLNEGTVNSQTIRLNLDEAKATLRILKDIFESHEFKNTDKPFYMPSFPADLPTFGPSVLKSSLYSRPK